MQYPKQKPFRSKKAIEWFRKQFCAFCITDRQVTGHHEPLNGHGMGSKGPDDEQIPMCLIHHRERHDKGRDSFYKKQNIKNWKELVECYKIGLHEYLRR